MTKTKSTKRALLMSALALLMCVSMLIGSTFAWFTDSVTSGVNTIQAGTLDIVLEYKDADGNWQDAEGKTLNFKTADNRTTDILWEPGCTYVLPAIRVRNNGNLALKYDIVINGVTGNAKLLEAIEFTANDKKITNFSGHLDTTNAVSEEITIAGHMKEEAGNEYQGLSIEGIGITVYATQYTYENDSFDDQYDAIGRIFAAGINYINGRYQINAELAYVSGVKTLAMNVRDQNGKLITTVTPEGYQIPADGKIDGLTMAAVVYGGDSSSWQNTPFVPSMSSVPTTAELVVNGTVVGIATIGTEHGVEWSEVVKAAVPHVSTADELKAALANGGNVALEADIISKDTTLDIAKGKDVTIDLNGKTLAGVNTASGTTALIKNSGNLTIIGNGTITVLAENPDTDWNPEGFPTYASNTIANSGNLTIESGVTIENQTAKGGASYAIDNYAGATLTVNGGKIIQSGGDVAIRMNTASATAENKVTINGGTISGKRAIWIHLAGSSAATAPKTTLEINGGNLSGTQMCIYSYSYGNSFANTNVTINGGTFNGNVEFGGGYKGDQETVSVTGGTFNGEIGRWVTSDDFEPLA